MPTQKGLLSALATYLVTNDVGRHPSRAGALPPIFLDPVRGAPAPGEREGTENDADLMLTLSPGGDIPPPYGQGVILMTTVDVRYRGRTAPRIYETDARVFDLLAAGDGGVGAKHGWDMAGLYVIESRQWAGLGRIGGEGGQGFDYRAAYYFEIYRD